jgi:two-component system, NarL family, sensor kinase
MKLRQKVLLLAVAPLLVALCVIALFVRQQAVSLAQQQRATIERAYLASKEAELRHYVELAQHAIARQVDSGRSDAATRKEAERILADLSFGDDGYFFVYDNHGRNIMHPRQPELVGHDLRELRDPAGAATIERLIARANNGGGLERYTWVKPSTGKPAPKLGYVVPVAHWGWMMGTGIYLDDVEAALSRIDTQQSQHIHRTLWWIAGLGSLLVITVASLGLALNIRDSRAADAKLKVLAQRVVESQELERGRLSRDLHDGISQSLVSIKLQMEAAAIRLAGNEEQRALGQLGVEKSALALTGVLGEVRRISHDLRPALLDDLGLAPALEHLAQESGDIVEFNSSGESVALAPEVATVLFRVAQEALANSIRHAGASHIAMGLAREGRRLVLTISDNGTGFDARQMASHPKQGIGLRNMSERLEAIGGSLDIASSAAGTVVHASVRLVEHAGVAA